jgi:hypothetical protein
MIHVSMKKKYLFLFVILLIVFSAYISYYFEFSNTNQLYKNLRLDGHLDKSIFALALDGKRKLCKYTTVLTIIDYTKPSTSKRLFLLDLWNEKMICNTYVAHGKNTGENYATIFSNENESHKSSLGFYKTGSTYYGKHGYSLRLSGLENGINDMAAHRAIVVHGADYVSEEFIKAHGRLGRSHGCPAVPMDMHKEIITKIKNGTCLFIFADNKDYKKKSVIYKQD